MTDVARNENSKWRQSLKYHTHPVASNPNSVAVDISRGFCIFHVQITDVARNEHSKWRQSLNEILFKSRQ